MEVTEHALFPTRVLTIEFSDTSALDQELCDLFEKGDEFAKHFNMHPDAMNLLRLADTVPAIARLRQMFLDGLKRWLAMGAADAPDEVDIVLFSNCASRGEFTLVHNHNADLVGVYYARTASSDRPPVYHPDNDDDYFEAGDGMLILHDPRFNANLAAVRNQDQVKVFARPGLMLIFPGYLWHSVTPHLGEFRRLSFSMNFTLRWPGGPTAERHALA
ncbi:MAG: hypothetical protein KAY46_03470 [Burkholderiaceae bacterium]|nr:hypothetical protein [Burkholderiaceae bacterium]